MDKEEFIYSSRPTYRQLVYCEPRATALRFKGLSRSLFINKRNLQMRKLARWASAVVCMSFFALVLPAWAEEEDIPLDKLPKAVVEAVKAKFKGAELVSASEEKDADGKTTYEVML